MVVMRYSIWPTELAHTIAQRRLRRSLLPGWSSSAELISTPVAWAMLQAAVLIALLLLVSGAGRPAVELQGRGDPAAAHAVEVLIGSQDTGPGRRAELIASVPAGYLSVMGYRPTMIEINGSLSLAKPIGACSSPVHLAFDMEPTCQGHDFGYDLLRYSAAIGAPLGEWARPLIDEWWYAAMHQRCDLVHSGAISLACHGQVLATETIIDVNSWREGNGPPIEENPWRYLGALAMLPLSLVGAARFRRADGLHPVGRLQIAPAMGAFTSRSQRPQASRSRHRSARRSQDQSDSTHARPASPILLARSRSSSSVRMLAATEAGDRGSSTTKPVSPARTASGAPPEVPATTGRPQAAASR